MKIKLCFIFFLFLIVLNACEKRKLKKEAEKIQEYIEEKHLSIEPLESGLYYKQISEGRGKLAEIGDTVEVRYSATRISGAHLAPSYYFNPYPQVFVVGNNNAIPAWEEAIQLMRANGKSFLIAPSKLAHGKEGMPPYINPYEPIIYNLTLIEIKN